MISKTHTDLVIFDCDGVLVDSEPLSNTVMAEHITRLGWSMTGAESMQRFKGSTMSHVHRAIEDHLGTQINHAWLDAFREELMDRMRTELCAIPGVKALISRVESAGFKTCVASQGRHEKMAISLGATGLLETFEGRIFSAVDVTNPKPAPDLFLHAAAKMGVTSDRCVVIEDSVTGVRAALAAGMRAIGYSSEGSGELARDGVIVVSAMEAITIT
jgi:HAD superfamily hydrolase (TIGR01509 family)